MTARVIASMSSRLKRDAARPSPPDPRPRMTPEDRQADRAAEAAEALEFLAWLEKETVVPKEDSPPRRSAPRRSGLRTVNLEEGMPSAEEAVQRLRIRLQELRSAQVRAVRLIHGYGSSGKGGAIRRAVRSELQAMQRRGWIRSWLPGERFGPFDPQSRALTDACPDLLRDPDYGRGNQGVTIVLL